MREGKESAMPGRREWEGVKGGDGYMTDQLEEPRHLVCDITTFTFNSRMRESRKVYPADVVLFEGILVLYDPDIREMMHMKLFVDTDSDTRLARRGAVFL